MTTDAKLPPRAWLIVALLWVGACLNYVDRVMITTMRGSIKDSIPMTDAQFGLLTTAFLLVYAVLSPFAGYLADRLNRSRVIIGSLLVWSLVTWLTEYAKTYEQLFTTRLLMGVSEACYIPAALALVADYHRGATRSLAIGVLLGGVMVGSALGGVGGWLAERQSWGFAFGLFGQIGIGFAAVLLLLLRDAPRDTADPVAPTEASEKIRLGAAIRSLFGSGAFILFFVYAGLYGFASWMVVGWMPTYLQEHFNLAQGRAGLLSSVYVNAGSLVGLVVGGAWADRWGRSNERSRIFVAAIGLVIAAPAIFVVANTSLLPLALAGLLLFGMTVAFASGEMMPILCLFVDRRYRATGFGILNLFACTVGGATTYAGGVLRDAQVDVNRLFQAGSFGLVVCALMLLFIRPRDPTAP